MKSPAAEAAKLLRMELKTAGLIGAKVKTRNYAGGSSLDVTLTDPTPEGRRLATAIADRFAFVKGSRVDDSQITEYADYPQASYSFVKVEFSPEAEKRAFDALVKEEVFPADAVDEYNVYYDLGTESKTVSQWIRWYLIG